MLQRYVGLAAAAIVLASVATCASAQEAERKGIPAPPGHVFKTIISGYEFRSKETRALQDDDLENPGFLAVERAGDVWKKIEGSEGKSCMSCHGEAETSMKGVGAAMPKWDDKLKKPVNLEQRINICRSERQQAKPFAYESKDLLALTAFVGRQSRGMPIAVADDAETRKAIESGRAMFTRRQGQLNLSCAQCHDDNWSGRLAGAPITQGQPTGYPIYRLEWQTVGSLQRRLRNCLTGIRTIVPALGAQDLVDLELYLMWRARGMSVETPGVRP